MTAELKEEISGKMLKCSQCPKEFKYNSERKRHELSHSPRFECEICCKKFSFVSALRRHQKQHERTGSVKCQECSRKFRDEVLLKRHIKYAHKGTYVCTKCNVPFNSDQALNTHMKSHKPESERRFKCSHEGCGKSFNFSHHLKHHELTHTNDKQYYCNVCGKGFIQSHHLKTHLKTHNPSEWLYCEFSGCKKKFSTEYARKRHMTIHKNKPDSGISSDSSSCDVSISRKYLAEDTILCPNCGENVSIEVFNEHCEKCATDNSNNNIESWDINDFKKDACEEVPEILSEEVLSFDKDIDDCKTALGGCIMTDNCVCAQITNPTEENYDFTPISTSNDANNENYNNESSDGKIGVEYKVLTKNDVKNEIGVDDFSYNVNACESCECADICGKDLTNCSKQNDAPKLEYRVDGVIKIKDTFDLDFSIKKEYKDHFPFSSCKDVIGNCIVGGNEGCLCAKMMIDDQQAMAQEIDDLTPQPKTD